jgi:glycosyltransferase involved in cell wall biosynthesis
MKIAFIGQKGIPVTFGGVEYHVDELARGLTRLGHDVRVYVRPWYTKKELKSYKGVRLIHVPTIKTKYLDASIHSFLCSIHALFTGVDIIHYHAIGPSFFSIIPYIFNKKIISTVHRLDWDSEKWGIFSKFFLKIGELISVTIPKKTIVVSRELKVYFSNHYQRKTIHISHGITVPLFKEPDIIKQKYNLNKREYILFMGRLSPEKRVDWLIRSFLKLNKNKESLKDIKLVIAGGSSATKGYIRKLKILSKNNPDIIFTGYVIGKEKAELLGSALIFVLPSYLEGSPIVLLEAMSYGLCCLISDIPPHRDIITNQTNGLFFNSRDANDLTLKLKWLLSQPNEIELFGEKAKDKLSKRLSWNEVVRETESLYKSIL